MAIIVAPTEDYTSLLSVAGFKSYHAARGNDVEDYDDTDDIEPALVRATDYFTYNYSEVEDDTFIDADDVVNSLVEKAVAQLAFHALTEDLFAIRDATEVVEQEDELEGVGKSRTRYAGRTGDRFPMVTKMLSSIATFTGGAVAVGRILR